MTTIVQFENVGLRYGPGAEAMPEALIPEALIDVSFSLQAGASYFLTGPSGAGKTSLLRLLCLAQRPSRGTVRLFGEDMVTIPRHQLPARRRRIGVVHQDARLIPHLSVAENVALPLRIAGQGGAGQGGADIDARVTETLDRVGLVDRAAAAPMTLSGGEQQRVAIARAVVGRPDLLIADEPTGNVDPATADRLMHLFAALGRHGTTVVVATHDSRLFTRLPDARMIRLAEGRLRDPAIMPRPPVPA